MMYKRNNLEINDIVYNNKEEQIVIFILTDALRPDPSPRP